MGGGEIPVRLRGGVRAVKMIFEYCDTTTDNFDTTFTMRDESYDHTGFTC